MVALVAVVAAVPSLVPCETLGGALVTLICLESAAGCRISGRSTAGWVHLSDQPPSPSRRAGCVGEKQCMCRGPAGRCRTVGLAIVCIYVQGICLPPPVAVAPRGEFRKQVKGPSVAAPPVAVAPLANLRDLCCPCVWPPPVAVAPKILRATHA